MKTGKITWWEIGLFVSGILIFGAGLKFEIHFLMQAGLMAAGTGLVAGGIDTIITKRASFSSSSEGGGSYYHHTYTGLGAVSWGAFSILLGFGAFLGGLFWLLGLMTQVAELIKARPGLWLIPVGIMAFFMGIHNLAGAREQRASFWSFLGSMPARIFGLALTAAGVVMVVFGMGKLF